MNTSIHNILNELGEAIASEQSAARDQAAQLNALRNGLQVILDGLISTSNSHPVPANDASGSNNRIKRKRVNAPADVAVAPASPTARTTTKNSCPDSTFIEALSIDWIGAGKLREHLTASGITIAEGTIYNRMRKLAAVRPDMIEAAAKPERWRLKVPAEDEASKPPQSKASAKPRKRRTLAPPPLPVLAPASNDNAMEMHLPVLHHGDCLDIMKSISDGSVDLILADLPYGVTRCEWDKPISLDKLWEQYRRIIKPTGAIVLFAAQPFTTKLGASNLEWLKYALVWEKSKPSGFLHAKNRPMMVHEDILVFTPGTTIHASMSKRRMTYNPQDVVSAGIKRVTARRTHVRHLGKERAHPHGTEYEAFTGYPRSWLRYGKDGADLGAEVHSFAKPVELLKYLIRTYSNPGETVLDNTMGSGSTCVAAMRTGRRSIGIELERRWFEVAQARVAAESLAGLKSVEPAHPIEKPAGDAREFTNDATISTRADVMQSHDLVAAIPATYPVIHLDQAVLNNSDCLDLMRTMESGSVVTLINLGRP